MKMLLPSLPPRLTKSGMATSSSWVLWLSTILVGAATVVFTRKDVLKWVKTS